MSQPHNPRRQYCSPMHYAGKQYIGGLRADFVVSGYHVRRDSITSTDAQIAQSNSLTVAAPYTAVYWYNRARRELDGFDTKYPRA